MLVQIEWKNIYLELGNALKMAFEDSDRKHQFLQLMNVGTNLIKFDKQLSAYENAPNAIKLQLLANYLKVIGLLFKTLSLPQCQALIVPLQKRMDHKLNPRVTIRPLRIDYVSKLDGAILFKLVIYLSLQDIASLRNTSRWLNTQIKACININASTFWQFKALCELSESQVESLGENLDETASTLLARNFPLKTLKKYFDFATRSSFFIPITDKSYSQKSIYSYRNSSVQFNLEDMTKLLLADNDQEFLTQATLYGKIYPLLKKHSSLYEVKTHLGQRNQNNDFSFISFFPILIKFKAIKCFEVLVRTYLALYFCENNSSANFHDFNSVFKLITICENQYFTRLFLSITLKVYPADTTCMDEVVKFAVVNEEYNDVFKKIYESLPEKKKEIILSRSKDSHYYQELLKIILGETYNLRKCFLDSAKDLLRNPEKSDEQLTEIYQAIHSALKVCQSELNYSQSPRI